MVTHSSILVGEIPWIEEPGGLKESDMTKQLSIIICSKELVLPTVSWHLLPGGPNQHTDQEQDRPTAFLLSDCQYKEESMRHKQNGRKEAAGMAMFCGFRATTCLCLVGS